MKAVEKFDYRKAINLAPMQLGGLDRPLLELLLIRPEP